jgi:C4-type Zn-finger protein
MGLATHFITLEMNLATHGEDLVTAIEATLAQQGEPLRWAITQVNQDTQTATVEAVVTTCSSL